MKKKRWIFLLVVTGSLLMVHETGRNSAMSTGGTTFTEKVLPVDVLRQIPANRNKGMPILVPASTKEKTAGYVERRFTVPIRRSGKHLP